MSTDTSATSTWSKKSKLSSEETIIPETIIGNGPVEKLNLEPKINAQEKESLPKVVAPAHTWFIVTFLMTVIILGSIYFYFRLEDKNNQIAELERKSFIKPPVVKGVSESAFKSTELALPDKTYSAKSWSLVNNTDIASEFTMSEISVAVPYFDNQLGSKTSFIRERTFENKKIKDGIEIFTVEKQLNTDQVSLNQKFLENTAGYEIDKTISTTKNNIKLTGFTSINNSKPVVYLGLTSSYMYAIVVYNESSINPSETKINSFMKTILNDLSLN